MEEVEQLAELILASSTVVAFTGAGISTESGIPDFRGPEGIWTKFDPEDFTIQRFVSSSAVRTMHWTMLREGRFSSEAEPNPAHYALAELYRLGKLNCAITQNIDNLHQKAGLPDTTVFELHGNMRRAVCLTCQRRFPLPDVLETMVQQKAESPLCPHCHGILKPDAVFFGEALPEDVLLQATRRSKSCDLFIVIGSTLVVYPAASMPSYATQAGAKLAVVNLTPTPLDRLASVLIRDKAGQAIPRVVERVRHRLNNRI